MLCSKTFLHPGQLRSSWCLIKQHASTSHAQCASPSAQLECARCARHPRNRSGYVAAAHGNAPARARRPTTRDSEGAWLRGRRARGGGRCRRRPGRQSGGLGGTPPASARRQPHTLGRLGLGLGRDCSDSDSATGRTRRGLSDQRSKATECETPLAVSRPSLLSVLSMYKLTG